MEYFGERAYGREFVDWLLKHTEALQLLSRLATDARVVPLPGMGGLGTKHPSGRCRSRISTSPTTA
jgi:aspartate 4-decarboxylase